MNNPRNRQRVASDPSRAAGPAQAGASRSANHLDPARAPRSAAQPAVGARQQAGRGSARPAAPAAELRIATRLARGIALVKLFPGLDEEILRAALSAPGLRAVVLETYGAGNAPTSGWFIRLLRETIARGVIVLNITQCGGGRVSMELYETGLRLQETGVLCGCDMTSEAAVTKLMYVLGLELPREETERLLRRPLRGEFTD